MSKDMKTHLKEMVDRGDLYPVDYDTKRVGGTEHEPAYTSTARLSDGREAMGGGRSKVEAEKNAAAALQQQHGLPRK
jgi:dsRNA-specific ribonuclease